MTNGDRIREMTNEELAKVIDSPCNACSFKSVDCVTGTDRCIDGVLAWLTKEATDD